MPSEKEPPTSGTRTDTPVPTSRTDQPVRPFATSRRSQSFTGYSSHPAHICGVPSDKLDPRWSSDR